MAPQRFAPRTNLASWAKFTPAGKESAGKNRGRNATGHGNRYLARVIGEAAAAAGRTDTFLGERYRRLAGRRGSKKALVAVGRSILVIICHLLSNPGAHFTDLGPDFFERRHDPEGRKRAHIHQLEASATGSPLTRSPDSPSPVPDPDTMSPRPEFRSW